MIPARANWLLGLGLNAYSPDWLGNTSCTPAPRTVTDPCAAVFLDAKADINARDASNSRERPWLRPFAFVVQRRTLCKRSADDK
jgi:hypothetical protein